jgi:HTH-type transcriptional regulator/antitoxin HigA
MTINTEAQYEAALAEIKPMFDRLDAFTAADDLRFEELGAAIHAYEKIHYPIGPPTDEARSAFAREMRGELAAVAA